MHKIVTVVMVILSLGTSIRIFSDEVTLVDGSRLVGTISKLQDGVLVLVTEHAGKITINMSGVAGIESEKVMGVALGDLEPHFGKLDFEGGEQRLLEENAAPRSIAVSDMILLWGAEQKMPKPARRWKGRVEFGTTGSDGNSDRFSFYGHSEATRETDATKLRLYLNSDYAEDSGVRSQDETKFGGQYEWKFSDRWSAYFRGELEEDKFEELDLRTTLVLGMAYRVIGKESHSLSTRLGLGYLRETYDTAASEDDAILDFGYDYMIGIRNWTKFTHDLTYYSAIDEPTNEFRIVANTAFEVPLSNGQHWKLRAGIKHEYDDAPLPGIENLDMTYFLNLIYDW